MIAIKENIQLWPLADVIYGCDAAWWKQVNGLPDAVGLKVAYEPHLRGRFPGINFIDIVKDRHRILIDRPGVIGSGGNSGFQALNLAVQWGVSAVLLIGFDMTDRSGVHWYGRNSGRGRNNPNEDLFRQWRRHFDAAALDLDTLGVEVINASKNSALKCFRKSTVEEALSGWGL